MTSKTFAKETNLVAAFCDWLGQTPYYVGRGKSNGEGWQVYHETAGWDLLLANTTTGLQIGIEAKLSLNPKVLSQALPSQTYWKDTGPDYRAVLVPSDGCQLHMRDICQHIGLSIITCGYRSEGWRPRRVLHCEPTRLPDQEDRWSDEGIWYPWLPAERHKLPAYIPDVVGGSASPVALTDWKIKAIKLLILLERRGAVTRADMNALQISQTRWTDRFYGYLSPGPNGYVANERTPDLRRQHPVNFAEIEADFDAWSPYRELSL